MLVAHREGVGQRVVERNVLRDRSSQVSAASRRIPYARMALHRAIGRGCHGCGHRSGRATNAAATPARSLCVSLHVQAERRVGFAGGVRLQPHGLAIGQRDGTWDR